MSIIKTKTSCSSGKAKPRPINVTHGARAENEMAKMEKEAKASSARGDPAGQYVPPLIHRKPNPYRGADTMVATPLSQAVLTGTDHPGRPNVAAAKGI
jgi:hypothetical protein